MIVIRDTNKGHLVFVQTVSGAHMSATSMKFAAVRTSQDDFIKQIGC
jgi:hypothetical protein